MPVLVVMGSDDERARSAGDLVSALPHGTLAMVPGDHGTAPAAPEFSAAVADFLAQPHGSPLGGMCRPPTDSSGNGRPLADPQAERDEPVSRAAPELARLPGLGRIRRLSWPATCATWPSAGRRFG